jgi:hypothetical protein
MPSGMSQAHASIWVDRPVLVATTIEYLFMDRAYHLSMSKIYFAVPADRMFADVLVREVPEEEEEDDDEEQGEDEEGEEDDDEGEGYSE